MNMFVKRNKSFSFIPKLTFNNHFQCNFNSIRYYSSKRLGRIKPKRIVVSRSKYQKQIAHSNIRNKINKVKNVMYKGYATSYIILFCISAGFAIYYLFADTSNYGLLKRSLNILHQSSWVKLYMGKDITLASKYRGMKIDEKEYLQDGLIHRAVQYRIKGNHGTGHVTCVFRQNDINNKRLQLYTLKIVLLNGDILNIIENGDKKEQIIRLSSHNNRYKSSSTWL